MSGTEKLEKLIRGIKSIIESEAKEIEIIKMCAGFYCVVDSENQKDEIINRVVTSIENEYLRASIVAKYILNRNVLKESKRMTFYNWIFINENIIKREFVIKKVSKGYLLLKKVDYPPIHYLDICDN